MTDEKLKRAIDGLSAPVPGKNYFTLSLTVDERGAMVWSTQSAWDGYVSLKPLVESRTPSAVHPDRMIAHWESTKVQYVVVSTEAQLFLYLKIGGHALIETNLAKKHFRFMSRSLPSRPHGEAGFISAEDLPGHAAHRAPSKALRLRVIKRDDWRCRICGRRPTDFVDVELHVHHIRPWGEGGVTLEDNLMTICGTCHSGLEPHFERQLFDLMGLSIGTAQEHVARHNAGVVRYRQLVKHTLEEETTAPSSKRLTSGLKRIAIRREQPKHPLSNSTRKRRTKADEVGFK